MRRRSVRERTREDILNDLRDALTDLESAAVDVENAIEDLDEDSESRPGLDALTAAVIRMHDLEHIGPARYCREACQIAEARR